MGTVNNAGVQGGVEFAARDVGCGGTGVGQKALQRTRGADFQLGEVFPAINRLLDHHLGRVDLVSRPIDIVFGRFIAKHLFEPEALMEIGGFPDITEGKRQARGNTREGDLVLGVSRGNGAHFQDAPADSVEDFLGFKQRACFVKFQLQTAIGALFKNGLESNQAVFIGTAGARPMGLDLPGKAFFSGSCRSAGQCGGQAQGQGRTVRDQGFSGGC